MNDGSKEPQEQDDYSTLSLGKCNWVWAFAEVNIQNSEWNDPKEVHERRNTTIKIIK